MTQVTVNGNNYSDNRESARDMLDGGHVLWLLPMISDTMVEVASAEAAATAAESSAAEALASGFKFTFSTTTAMADPGAGIVRFNHATIASVTALAFDATSADTGNPDVSDFIATWGSSTNTTKGYITFRKIGTPATFVIFAVTAAVTDNTGWLQVTVSYVAGAGSISNADVLAVGFDKVADKGVDGADGTDGEVTLATAQTLQNKSLEDSTTYIVDNSDNTKKFQVQVSGISTGTTRTMTVPDKNFTVASLDTNTFTGAQVMSDQQVSRAMLVDQAYVFVDKGNSGTSTQTLDYTAGSHQKITATGNHTIATSNWPPSGNLGEMLLEAVDFGAFTVTLPSWNWVKPDGTTTTSVATYLAANTGRTSFQSSGTDFILLWGRDGGTTIYAKLV